MAEFSHIDADGKAIMVDVSDKDVTERSATAATVPTSEPRVRYVFSEVRAS